MIVARRERRRLTIITGQMRSTRVSRCAIIGAIFYRFIDAADRQICSRAFSHELFAGGASDTDMPPGFSAFSHLFTLPISLASLISLRHYVSR